MYSNSSIHHLAVAMDEWSTHIDWTILNSNPFEDFSEKGKETQRSFGWLIHLLPINVPQSRQIEWVGLSSWFDFQAHFIYTCQWTKSSYSSNNLDSCRLQCNPSLSIILQYYFILFCIFLSLYVKKVVPLVQYFFFESCSTPLPLCSWSHSFLIWRPLKESWWEWFTGTTYLHRRL